MLMVMGVRAHWCSGASWQEQRPDAWLSHRIDGGIQLKRNWMVLLAR